MVFLGQTNLKGQKNGTLFIPNLNHIGQFGEKDLKLLLSPLFKGFDRLLDC